MRKHPRKPSQPLGHIVFPKRGRPYTVLEPLPESQKELEARIVRKFIGAMRYFEHRELATPVEADLWPDFETREGETKVGIEVVEVVNPDHAEKGRIQQLYAARVRELLDDMQARLAGLSVRLDDGYQEPPYPPLRSKAGERLARSIAENLRVAAAKLDRLPVGHVAVYRWRTGRDVPNTGASITRVSAPEAEHAVRLGYLGSFPERQDVGEALLAATIASKIARLYTRYEGRLLLLAYGCGAWHGDAVMKQARRVLREHPHPFDEVWHILPFAGEDVGDIRRVWP